MRRGRPGWVEPSMALALYGDTSSLRGHDDLTFEPSNERCLRDQSVASHQFAGTQCLRRLLTVTAQLICDAMKALQALHRSASARLLLGRREQGRDIQQPDEAAMDVDKSPLDATLSKIGFGLYQKKLL